MNEFPCTCAPKCPSTGFHYGRVIGEQARLIERLRQGLWDCVGAAGADRDGEPRVQPSIPHADLVEFALLAVRSLRADYNACLSELP